MTSLPGGNAAVLALSLAAPFWAATPAQQQRAPRATSPASSTLTSGEWSDNFDARGLDTAKWEPFGFEGDRKAAVDVSNGQLRLRGRVGSRAGVRSRPMFVGDSYVVEATVAKAGHVAADLPAGNAILTLLFDDTGYNRIEWLITSEGVFEAWAVLHDRGERLDMGNIGTRVPNPRLAIARRGREFTFMVNDQVALTRTIRGVPRAFRVFLYGFSSSENVWDAVRVAVASPM